jgi:hypothetical protein
MNRSTSTVLGLTFAVALSTGAMLVKQPVSKDLAPGAYSDILIAEDSPRQAPAGEKSAVPTDNTQSGAHSQKMTGTESSAQGSQGDRNNGNPPR